MVGLFFAAQVYVDFQYAGVEIGFGQAIYLALADWYLWALASPLIYWVARKAPLERGAWMRSLAIHIPFTLFLTLFKSFVETILIETTAPALFREPSLARMNAAFVTCWLIVVGCHALLHYRTSTERERRALKLEGELSQAQLQLLKNQLQPHFLFNTLHSIGTLMHRDVPAAEVMLTQLSDLLRSTLDHGDRPIVPLKEELEFVHLYLKIQETRFQDRLQVRTQVDPDALDLHVPNMILQPLVENAVVHGVAPRAQGGTITIRASRKERRIVLQITDDGPGLPDGAPASNGIGLANTRTRLAHLYGDDQTMTLETPDSGGLRVTLTFPAVSEGAS